MLAAKVHPYVLWDLPRRELVASKDVRDHFSEWRFRGADGAV